MWQYVAAVVNSLTFNDWIILTTGVVLVLYFLGTWNYDYFLKRGIGSTRPKIPFLGDSLQSILGTISTFDLLLDLHRRGEGHGVFGFFELTTPMFLIRDPEIIKFVTIKEFDSFMNHREIQLGKADRILNSNLFNIRDQSWKNMRGTLSPAFTSGKIKGMFPLISECGSQMTEYLQQKYVCSQEGSRGESLPVDTKDLFSRMANDVIATAAFGLKCDSMKQPENEFYRMGKIITTFSKLRTFVFIGYMIFPKFMQALGLRVLDGKATHFFDSLVHDTIRERQANNIFRPDVLQLLMQVREGQLKAEKEDTDESQELRNEHQKLSDEDLSAQGIIFFFAGFETVSAVLCLTSHMISHHKDIQERLYEEVRELMEKTAGKPTYDSVQSMKYLDSVISETLRLYPPSVITDRQCGKDVQLPAGAESAPISIRKGQMMNISIVGIHRDPQYWEEPEKFDPDRFSDENKHNIRPFTYMPFGVGPRICIGQRFAVVEVKLALVHLLSKFELHPSAKTKHPLQFSPTLNIKVEGGFWCGLKPRNVCVE